MLGGLGGEFPIPLGGGGELPAIQHAELLHGYGSAFDPSPDTMLWVRCYADALTLVSGRCASDGALAQHDPLTATEQLPVWERMLDQRPQGRDLVERQNAASAHLALLGRDTSFQELEAQLRAALGDTLVSLQLVPLALANVSLPSPGYPWPAHINGVWSSSVAHLVVHLRRLPNVSLAMLLEQVGVMRDLFDRRVNAWLTYDWHTEASFLLDQDNIDVAVFDA